MKGRLGLVLPAAKGPLATASLAELGLLDAALDSVDSMNEADPGRRASKAALAAGQAAVNRVNARRGRK